MPLLFLRTTRTRKPRIAPAVLLREQLWKLKATGQIPGWEEEFFFAKPRKWKADFAWPDHRLLLEVEGGTWVAGRHSRGAGYANDCEKYNHAQLLGYRVLRATTEQVTKGLAINWILRALKQVN